MLSEYRKCLVFGGGCTLNDFEGGGVREVSEAGSDATAHSKDSPRVPEGNLAQFCAH